MENTEEFGKSAVEVLEILKFCSEDVISRIPQKFINYLEDIQSYDYVFRYDKNKKLEEQNLLPGTYYIMGLIYKDYICDEKERADYVKELNDFMHNEQKMKEQKYPIDSLFSNSKEKNTEKPEQKALIKIEKTSWVKNLFNKVKNILTKKDA